MKTMLAGWRRLWQHKGTWLAVTGMAAGEAGLLAWWLTLPVATAWNLALHAAVLILMLGFAVLAWRMTRRAFPKGRWQVWPAVPLALAAGIALPAALVWWVPGFESMEAQAVSMALRFVLAGVLFTGSLLWLAACGAAQVEEGSVEG